MTKKEIICDLLDLPDGLIEKAYSLDVVNRKLQMQYNSLLEAEMIDCLDEQQEDFLYYHYKGYWIVMEKED